ncbi:hypothetical protein C1H46_018430 [Malus baccata]|uniref:Uncharacterized protein n=1 Tax=Malus baccata TaxID=106549 RepID=A0A540MB24_MALBA|nr:hypothetical protein C1H46_018430 [Malus baccata]
MSTDNMLFPVSSPYSSSSSITDDAAMAASCTATTSRTDNDPSSFSIAINHCRGEPFVTSLTTNRIEL